MGATGPCGPCSEIHYDHVGGGRNAAHLVNADDFDVVEIWNNVFMQFNREADGSLKTLPAQHVDTGMGFERLVAALNGTKSNYDTDVFSPIFARISELTGVRPYTGKFGPEADPEGIDTAYRVIADHVRCLTFALSDGGVPSNVGRGYVLRRILRRGARYARKKLGVELGTFFSSIVPAVVESQGYFFPEITHEAKLAEVKEMLDEEERSFARTLDRGEKLFDGYAQEALKKGGKELSGDDVWRLYDTYGFPVDLTRLMAEELGLSVNEAEFEKAQAHSKELSKAGSAGKKGGKDAVKLDVHDIAALEKNAEASKTDDSPKYGALLFGPSWLPRFADDSTRSLRKHLINSPSYLFRAVLPHLHERHPHRHFIRCHPRPHTLLRGERWTGVRSGRYRDRRRGRVLRGECPGLQRLRRAYRGDEVRQALRR